MFTSRILASEINNKHCQLRQVNQITNPHPDKDNGSEAPSIVINLKQFEEVDVMIVVSTLLDNSFCRLRNSCEY